MVTDALPVDGDRAQLVLVGAIAIGIVLIGMTTVLNSAVFTENVVGDRSVETTGEATEFDREAQRNVRSLALRVNHDDVYWDTGAERDRLEDNLGENVTSYSRALAESYADTGSVYVNVTYEDTMKIGGRIVQDRDEDLSRNPGTPTWSPASAPPGFQIGWFVMNVDVENVSQTDHAYVELTDASGTPMNVSMRQSVDGKLLVNSSVGGGNVTNATCEPTNGRVLLDVLGGSSYQGSCSFNSTEHLDSPYTELRFVDGNNWRGKYDVVLNDSVPAAGVPPCAATPQEPCRGIAAWSIEFETRYVAGSFAYERTHNVSVYDG